VIADTWLSLGGLAATLAAAHGGYVLYVRWIERRRAAELSWRAAPAGLAAGMALGAGIFLLTLGSIWLLGYYRVVGTNPAGVLVAALTGALMTAYLEELVFRGIVLRILEEGLGTWTALAATAAIFGLLHVDRPHATWVSTTAIVASAGLLLGAAFVASRRLWLPIGIHFAWNFTQGGIFGVAVSGRREPGWLISELTGPPLLSGGEFGAEASIFVVVLALGATALMLGRGHGPSACRRAHRPSPRPAASSAMAASIQSAADPERRDEALHRAGVGDGAGVRSLVRRGLRRRVGAEPDAHPEAIAVLAVEHDQGAEASIVIPLQAAAHLAAVGDPAQRAPGFLDRAASDDLARVQPDRILGEKLGLVALAGDIVAQSLRALAHASGVEVDEAVLAEAVQVAIGVGLTVGDHGRAHDAEWGGHRHHRVITVGQGVGAERPRRRLVARDRVLHRLLQFA
jgi:hypothetical protein